MAPIMRSLKGMFGKKDAEKAADSETSLFEMITAQAAESIDIVKKEAEEENKVEEASKKAVSAVSMITDKDRRQQTVGDELRLVATARQEAQKRLDELNSELSSSRKLVSTLMRSLEKEHSGVEEEIRTITERKEHLQTFLQDVSKNITLYEQVFQGREKDEHISNLKKIGKKIETARNDNIDAVVLSELVRIEKYCVQLERLSRMIESLVDDLRKPSSFEFSGSDYKEMMRRLDTMQESINQKLTPAIQAHKTIVKEIFTKLAKLDSMNRIFKQRELDAANLERTVSVEESQARSANAERKIAELEKRLVESSAENSTLKENVSRMESELGDVKERFSDMASEFKHAKEAAKKSEEEKAKLDSLLSKLRTEEIGSTSKLQELLAEREKYAHSCEERAKSAEHELKSMQERINALEREKNQLGMTIAAMESGIKLTDESFKALNADKKRLEEELSKKASGEKSAMSKEQQDMLTLLSEELDNTRKKMQEMLAEKHRLQDELMVAKSRLSESKEELESFSPTVSRLEEERQLAAEELEHTKKLLDEISESQKGIIKELHRRVKELSDRNIELEDAIGDRDKKIHDLTVEVAESENELEGMFESFSQVSASKEELKGILNVYAEGKKKLEAHLSELEKMNESLAIQLAEKEKAATELASNLESLKELLNTEKKGAMDELQRLTERNKELSEFLEEIKQDNQELLARLNKLKSEREADQEEMRRLQDGINEKITLIRRLTDKIKENEATISDVRQKAEGAESRISEINDLLEQTERERDNAHAELKSMEMRYSKNVDDERSKVDELSGRIAELEHIQVQVEQEMTGLQAAINERDEEIKSARAEIMLSKGETSRLQAIVSARSEEITEAKGRLSDAARQITKLSGLITEREEEIVSLRNEMEVSKTEKTLLKEKISAKEDDIHNAKKEISALEAERSNLQAAIAGRENEIDDANARIQKTEAEKARLGEEIAAKDSEIKSSRAEARNLEIEKRAVEERNALHQKTEEYLKKELENAMKLRDMNRELDEHNKRLLQDLKELKAAYEADRSNLTQQIEIMKGQVAKLAEEKKEFLEEVNSLHNKIMPLSIAASKNPELREKLAETKALLDEKKAELEDISRRFTMKEQQQNATMETVNALEQQIRHTAALIDAQLQDNKATEERRIKFERMVKFNDRIRAIAEKIDSAKRCSEPEEAIQFIDDAIEMANNEKKRVVLYNKQEQREYNTEHELSRLDNWIWHATSLRENIDKAAGRKNIDKQKSQVIKASGIGILVPTNSESFSEIVTQFYDPSGTSRENVKWIVLDYNKDRFTFGRISRPGSEDGFKGEKCDVIFTAPIGPVRQISREHFQIVTTQEGYDIDALSSTPLAFVIEPGVSYEIKGKGGEQYKVTLPVSGDQISGTGMKLFTRKTSSGEKTMISIPKGMKLALKDGMTFFIDPDFDFGFRFTRMHMFDIQRLQKIKWHKTTIEYAEAVGYLEIPMHASGAFTASKEDKTFGKSDRILLNKHIVTIGRSPDNDVRVRASEKYFSLVREEVDEDTGDVSKNSCFKRMEELIAEKHAIIRKEGTHYFIKSAGRLETFVNYSPVDKDQELKAGDIIHIGENEPIFFIFRTVIAQDAYEMIWEKFGVVFEYANFECPPVKAQVGTLNFPWNFKVIIEDKEHKLSYSDERRITLNKYVTTIGRTEDNTITVSKCDSRIVDSQGHGCMENLTDRMIAITREFGQVYTIRLLDKKAKARLIHSRDGMLKAEELKFAEKEDSRFVLDSYDAIEILGNNNTFMIFAINETGVAEKDMWINARLEIEHAKRYETVDDLRGRLSGERRHSLVGRITKKASQFFGVL